MSVTTSSSVACLSDTLMRTCLSRKQANHILNGRRWRGMGCMGETLIDPCHGYPDSPCLMPGAYVTRSSFCRKSYDPARSVHGGGSGIRTQEARHHACSLSRRVHSTTLPTHHCMPVVPLRSMPQQIGTTKAYHGNDTIRSYVVLMAEGTVTFGLAHAQPTRLQSRRWSQGRVWSFNLRFMGRQLNFIEMMETNFDTIWNYGSVDASSCISER